MNDEGGRFSLAGIEYHGQAGVTEPCLRAIERLLYHYESINHALILTCKEHQESSGHAILLTTEIGDNIVIKSGFSSGYWGTGPRGFSRAIGLLDWYGVDIEEIDITEPCLRRLEESALTMADLEDLKAAKRILPTRLWDYVADQDYVKASGRNPWRDFERVVPMAIIDDRLAELARTFWNDPDAALSKAYRQLETIVRGRIGVGLEEAATLGPARLFAKAFNGPSAPLTWRDTTAGEREGRANLFIGTAKAYRNPRAHREPSNRSDEQLAELLLLNHLYTLEHGAVAA
jgi:hypothetical protein